MDFRELLNVANYNSSEAKYESSVKRYSTVLPPPKKPDKSSVQSDSIRRFLEKKKAEEAAKAAEARKQKEKLLELRSQNSKSNKKAKLMAARTKDNDFSKIKLSEDELLTKKKIEIELQRKHLMDKKERMKARIELEEKELLQPKKRKRKSKNNEPEVEEPPEEKIEDMPRSNRDKNHSSSNGVRKPMKPPPAMSFEELLKVAATKMNEPVSIAPKKKEEERLMTKKERRIHEEERERLRRKQERLEKGIEPSLYHKTPNGKTKTVTKNPHVVHIETDKTTNDPSKFKIPKNIPTVKNTDKSKVASSSTSKLPPSTKLPSNSQKEPGISKLPLKNKESISSPRPENSVQKKSKVRPISQPPPRPVSPPRPKLDPEALAADIERRVREKLEKQMSENLEKQIAADIERKVQEKLEREMAEKYRIALEEQRKKLNLVDSPPPKPKPVEQAKPRPPVNGKVLDKSVKVRKELVTQKPVPKPPPKKPTILNPYLEPPRRRLEPIIPPKRKDKRRVLDSDEEEDDDDDMCDFIDDGPCEEDENYSQYIKQIFGYDRNKYIDDDDDDIVETSFAEQMKEEMKSAKLGYLEDLEEERKQRKEEMEKKKKMKLKK